MIDKNDLVKWLQKVDKNLKKHILVVAVGGTAMTLLGLKSSTVDVDFCVNSKDKEELEAAISGTFKVDIFVDGYIFSEQLPDDYMSKAKEMIEMKNITLKALSPTDIIITKAARLNARDEEDIEALAKHVDKEILVKRFKIVVKTYAGSEKQYNENFNHILKMFF